MGVVVNMLSTELLSKRSFDDFLKVCIIKLTLTHLIN